MNRRGFLGRAGLAVAGLVAPRAALEAVEAVEGDAPASVAVAAPSAPLVASGGLCAPLTPYYSLQMSASDRVATRARVPLGVREAS